MDSSTPQDNSSKGARKESEGDDHQTRGGFHDQKNDICAIHLKNFDRSRGNLAGG